jgi:hypothetical protein
MCVHNEKKGKKTGKECEIPMHLLKFHNLPMVHALLKIGKNRKVHVHVRVYVAKKRKSKQCLPLRIHLPDMTKDSKAVLGFHTTFSKISLVCLDLKGCLVTLTEVLYYPDGDQ